MGLTGLEIYKHLPKKNCGECGPPTCLAFAMSLANGKATLDKCPYITDEAKEALESASAPPIAKIVAGVDDNEVIMGEETELFRHDKKFYNENAVAVRISDKLSADELNAKIEEINGLVLERVGMQYKVQFAAVENESGDAEAFVEAVKAVALKTEVTPMLITSDTEAMKKAADITEDKKPLLCCATEDNYEAMTEIAKEKDCPLVVRAEGLEALAELSKKISDLGHKKLVLDPGHREESQVCADFVQIRRQCIKKKFRPLGYPLIAFTTAEDSFEEINEAVAYTSKFASVVVINSSKKAELLPLLSWRQNLYTDPQVPIQVEEKLYAVGEPDENSPVYITTNFSLTYYTVEGEIESSKIPAWVIPVATDGTSVLTAYAAGKYEPEKIAEVMKKVGVEEKVSHKNVVVPGLVAVVSGKLEESSGWKVIVGPREASGIPAFAKANFA